MILQIMQIGIIGLPNVGKSTLFQILTKKQVAISNYPFCTIDPNVGVVKVPDSRLKKIAKLVPGIRVLPAQVEFSDIAGLVRNAHKGEGLGNQFLARIREVDAIIHVVRGFSDPNIQNTEKNINPERDIKIINSELALADLAAVQKRIEKTRRAGEDKEKIKELEFLKKLEKYLKKRDLIKDKKFNKEEERIIHSLSLLTSKPTIQLLNCDENRRPEENPKIDLALPLRLELEISELPAKEQKEYRDELNLKETGINKLIRSSFKILDLITFYTIKGTKQLRAWPVPSGILAPKAAGRVHTDFEQGFIKAEVANWQELIVAGSWVKAHDLGLIKTKGKDYIVRDGDVIEFKFKT